MTAIKSFQPLPQGVLIAANREKLPFNAEQTLQDTVFRSKLPPKPPPLVFKELPREPYNPIILIAVVVAVIYLIKS